jgi:hypothetical protein
MGNLVGDSGVARVVGRVTNTTKTAGRGVHCKRCSWRIRRDTIWHGVVGINTTGFGAYGESSGSNLAEETI